ncbi:MAG: hypothetical protein QXZ09_05745 [Candidatus Methanomethylicaceae archaeon]
MRERGWPALLWALMRSAGLVGKLWVGGSAMGWWQKFRLRVLAPGLVAVLRAIWLKHGERWALAVREARTLEEARRFLDAQLDDVIAEVERLL